MPTFAEQAAANMARTGGVQAQLQMGRDKIQQAQFAAEMAARQEAQDFEQQQFMQEIALRQQELGSQDAWRNAQMDLERQRMGVDQSQWGQEFGLRQAQDERLAALQDFELSQAMREQGVAGGFAGMSGMEGAGGYWASPEAQYIDSLGLDPVTKGMMHQEAQGMFLAGMKAGGTATDPLVQRKRELEIMGMERDLGMGDGPQRITPEMVESESALRKEFEGRQDIKEFRGLEGAIGRVVASAKNPTPAGDMALVFNFMRMQDPGSVVRESEFKNAAQARAWLSSMDDAGEGMRVPSFVRQAIQKAEVGTFLLPEQRKDFLQRSVAIYNDQANLYNRRASRFRDIADQYGYKSDRIAQMSEPLDLSGVDVGQLIQSGSSAMQQGGAKSPSVGTVDQGYRYKGGDPANPNSWEKI